MKTIVNISDLHVGHKKAIASPTAKIPQEDEEEQTTLEINAKQRALWESWKYIVEKWKHPDCLVLNGESIDGAGPKSAGVEQWTTDLDAQIEEAVKLVSMFKAKKYLVTRGSDYHVSLKGMNLDQAFAKRLREVTRVPVESGYEIFTSCEDLVLNYAHHIMGTSSMMYRGTALSREMMQVQLVANRKRHADILCRGHVHYFSYIEFTHARAFTLPAWKFQDWYMYRKSAGGTVPDIGAVRFKISGADFSFEKFLPRNERFRPRVSVI